MTDSQLLKVLRAIDAHQERIHSLIGKVADSGRADAEELSKRLKEQILSYTWAECVGGRYLGKGWVKEDGGYHYKKGSNA